MPLVFCFSTELLSSFTTKRCLKLAGLGSEVCCTVRATLLSLQIRSFFSKRPSMSWSRIAKGRGKKKNTFWAKFVITRLTLTAQSYNKRQMFASMGLNTLEQKQKSTHIEYRAVQKSWAGFGECLWTQKYVSNYKNMKDMKVHREHRPLPRHWSNQVFIHNEILYLHLSLRVWG